MTKRKKERAVAMGVVFLLAAGAGIGVVAQNQISGKGRDFVLDVENEGFDLADGGRIERIRQIGITTGDAPFEMIDQNCSGTTVISADGEVKAMGYCDGIDPDGDVFWITWQTEGSKNRWTILGGTGKFEGLEGGGNSWPGAAEWGDGKSSGTWDGTWRKRGS